MKTSEDEINDLKTKNNELVLKVQYWKMTAAQRENEKLELMKELNDLRLKLARLRSGGAAQARKLDAALQSASEEALKHLVHASSAVAHTIELAKTYMRDRQDLEEASPRWSNISGTPSKERVHRVPPMNVGGQSIQPVVALSRAVLNTSNPRSTSRSPNPNRSISALPMHMLQDVYIPLTRIDAYERVENNVDAEEDTNMDESVEVEDTSQEESQNITEEFDTESSRRLDALIEDLEPEDEVATPPRSRVDNPLEGPSTLLDTPTPTVKRNRSEAPRTLEPDSTTKPETSRGPDTTEDAEKENAPVCEFSPTVRRRRRPSTPPPSRSSYSTSGRVLKVMVAKMRLDGEDEGASPPKRAARGTPPARHSFMRFDAPSPNGATDAGVIVCETISAGSPVCGGAGDADSRGVTSHDSDSEPIAELRARKPKQSAGYRDLPPSEETSPSRVSPVGADCDSASVDNSSVTSLESRDSDGAPHNARTRRARRAVTYKEKPLNRKMRR